MSGRTVRAQAAGTFLIGGELPVARLGFGSMQLTGPHAFGPPPDADRARRVLRDAVDLGVNLIDTADAYGPETVETLIAEALHPYPDDLVIASKGGFVRGPRAEWIVDARPEHLRVALEGSLRRLRVETIDLYQLHRVDARVPIEDQVGTLDDLRTQGKIRHIGLSQVSVDQLRAAAAVTPIATVQNLYNLADRSAEDLVRVAAETGIGFIPWFPLATGGLVDGRGALGSVAARTGATPSQIALAWLLHRTTTMLPIPGTSSPEHLRDNIAAGGIALTADEIALLDSHPA
ncbi:aldo/keto reductase [Microbacterium awajiense]|uniref:Aldo/keto reductase n=1 Tax=Microbacterium awajiense TaxID=415214 RepID=A0ABP7AIA3_9MICO